MFENDFNDWTSTKTYATRENLERAIVKAGLDKVPAILHVLTPDHRHTAIFGKNMLEGAGINFMHAIWAGFKVIG